MSEHRCECTNEYRWGVEHPDGSGHCLQCGRQTGKPKQQPFYLVTLNDYEESQWQVLTRPAGESQTPLEDAWAAAIRKVLADTADSTEHLSSWDYFKLAVAALCEAEGYVPVEYAAEADESITHHCPGTAGYELGERIYGREDREAE